MAVSRWLLVAAALLLPACSSPEAGRARGGGAGADPRNIGDVVEMHGGSQPFFETPCRSASGAPCDEPRRVVAR